jgi:hypothetical protein
MMLKWLALGFWRYFTSFWTILDFVIVFVSENRQNQSKGEQATHTLIILNLSHLFLYIHILLLAAF